MAIIIKDLKAGTKFSEHQYYSFVKTVGDKTQLQNDAGENIILSNKYIETFLTTADQFTETKTIGKIEAANEFIKSTSVALTVNFNKQVKEVDAKKQMYELYANKGGKVLSEADYKKKVDAVLKSVITGEERTMIGRHYGVITELGRVQFIDMEEVRDLTKTAYDSRYKQVDPRTINWLIVRGIKYIVK